MGPVPDLLTEALSRRPPPILYHYTTQVGLLGILKSRELWATHTQYLNDRQEYLQAADGVKAEIAKRLANSSGEHQRILLDMQAGIAGIESMNVCVCSFSEDGDSLSQWRAYGGPSSAFAIGFKSNELRAIATSENSYLAPCRYREEEHQEVISTLITEIVERNGRRLCVGEQLIEDDFTKQFERVLAEDIKLLTPRGGDLGALLHRFGPLIKHESFFAEKEWRIITRPLACTLERFGFREGRSMLIPYYGLQLSKSDGQMPIEEILVGPTPNMERSCGAVKGLLFKHDLKDVEITPSKVPYRNW